MRFDIGHGERPTESRIVIAGLAGGPAVRRLSRGPDSTRTNSTSHAANPPLMPHPVTSFAPSAIDAAQR